MSTEIFSLEGKVAVVTGASRGIGRAIALGFARAGADVAVAARTIADLETLAEEIDSIGRRALPIGTDVTDRHQVENLIDSTVKELGGLDVLVNNAGGARFMSPFVAVRPEGWDKVMSLNLDAVFHATQIGAWKMLELGGGSIIQMSSVAGVRGAELVSYYSAAKGAVRLMTQSAAKELAQSGVRLNSIAPGWIATDLNVALRDGSTMEESIVTSIPMGRWGTSEEVVGAAIFLASDASSFVTGATIIVDGGQTA